MQAQYNRIWPLFLMWQVLEQTLKDKLEAEQKLRPAVPPRASATGADAPPPMGGGGGGGAVEKESGMATVELGCFVDADELLASVGLKEKYAVVFEEEAMDPDTLIEVLQQQGASRLGTRWHAHEMAWAWSMDVTLTLPQPT